MSAKIYCRTTAKGIQTYYLTDGKRDYYLFNSTFHKSNKEFFSHGKFIQEVLAAKRHVSASVRRVSVRIISMVKYIEGEYGLCVLHKTEKRQQIKRRSTKLLRKSQLAEELVAV